MKIFILSCEVTPSGLAPAPADAFAYPFALALSKNLWPSFRRALFFASIRLDEQVRPAPGMQKTLGIYAEGSRDPVRISSADPLALA